MELNIVNFFLLGMVQLTNFQLTASNKTTGVEDIKPTPVLSQNNESFFSLNAFNDKFNSSSILSSSEDILEIIDGNNEKTPSFIPDKSSSYITNVTMLTSLKNSLKPMQTLSEQFHLKSTSVFDVHSREHFLNASITPKDFVFLSNDEIDENSVEYGQNNISSSFVPSQRHLMSLESSQSSSMDHETSSISPTPAFLSSVYNETLSSHHPEIWETNTKENLNATILQFMMTFHGDCSEPDERPSFQFTTFQESIRNATGIDNDALSVGSNFCHREVIEIPVNISVENNIEVVFRSLKSLIRKFNISVEANNKTKTLTLVSVRIISSYESVDNERGKRSFLVEYLPYIIIGAVFGGILLIALVLICSKCCCNYKKKKRGKRPDFDVPHLSLRPEDYILTRIPRPTTIYTDNMATPIIHDEGSLNSAQGNYTHDRIYGQSFETSVVPMEEVMMAEDPYLRYKMHEYHQDENSGELRTFNGKRLHHRSTETDDSIMFRNSQHMGSTEKLHRTSRDMYGFDNQAYVKI